jgi:hypothetical protein
MSKLASTHLALSVPLAIQRIRERGGVTERDIQWAQERMQTMIRDGAGGHAIAFLDKGQTTLEMNLLTEVLAILSFVPGGVRFLGLRFNAEQPSFALTLDDALLRELEPFRAAMEREERESRKLDEVSAAELARLRVLEGELVQAADRGDTVQQALIEAEMDGILLVQQRVVQSVPVGEVVRQALFDEIGA